MSFNQARHLHILSNYFIVYRIPVSSYSVFGRVKYSWISDVYGHRCDVWFLRVFTIWSLI